MVLNGRLKNASALSLIAEAILFISGVPWSAPMPWRANRKATRSENTLTPIKKYSQDIAVTYPPNKRFEAVVQVACVVRTTPKNATSETRGKVTGSVSSGLGSVE